MDEVGAVCSGEDELIVARGGKGGKGNVHFATGSRRTPDLAQAGQDGQQRELLLKYRIYAGTALIEPGFPEVGVLLPGLLGRDAEAVDWGVYLRKPRWVRVEHDYHRYDVAYLPLLGDTPANLQCDFLEHLFWAETALVNLAPYGDAAEEMADMLAERIIDLPLKRLRSVAVAATVPLSAPRVFKTAAGECMVNCAVVHDEDDIRGLLEAQLSGGIVT
jgi:hypothetical protein